MAGHDKVDRQIVMGKTYYEKFMTTCCVKNNKIWGEWEEKPKLFHPCSPNLPKLEEKKKASSSLLFLTEKSKEEERVLLLYVRFGWGLRRGKYLETLGKFCIKKMVSSSSNHSMA